MPWSPFLILVLTSVSPSWFCHALVTFLILVLSSAHPSWFCNSLVIFSHSSGPFVISLMILQCLDYPFTFILVVSSPYPLPCPGHSSSFWWSHVHIPHDFANSWTNFLILDVFSLYLSPFCHGWSPFLILVDSSASLSWFCHALVTLPHFNGLSGISLGVLPCPGQPSSF